MFNGNSQIWDQIMILGSGKHHTWFLGGVNAVSARPQCGQTPRDTTGVEEAVHALPARPLGTNASQVPGLFCFQAMTLLQENTINTCVIYQHTGMPTMWVGQRTQTLLTNRKVKHTCKESSANAGPSHWALEGVWTLLGPLQGCLPCDCLGLGEVLMRNRIC